MAQEIDTHLRVVRQVLRQPILSEIARGGLTGPQLTVLEALYHNDGMSLKELRKKVGLAHSTISGIVDRLEKNGVVARRGDAKDGRLSRIFLSAAVQHFIQHSMPDARLHPLVTALQGLKPAQREAILDSMRLLRQAVGKTDGTNDASVQPKHPA